MKRFIKCILCLCVLFSIESYATVQIQPGLSLSQGGNSYLIRYTSDDIQVLDTILIGDGDEYKFSYVQLLPDYYDYVGEECSPMYPAYTLHLELPLNATNVQIHVNSINYTHVDLDFPYLPVQSSITGQPEIVCYDHILYSNSYLMDQYYQDWYVLGQTYIRLFAKGVDFSLYPVHYHLSGSADVLIEAEFEITYDGDCIDNLYHLTDPTSAHFFDNYRDNEYYHLFEEEPVLEKEPYLIITERQYEDSILVFKSHKESLGYNVFVEFVEDIGHTPDEIRQRIISYYTGCQLKYVLLVGSLNAIPFSYGQEDHFSNPPTDIYYTCLDNLYIDDQKAYHPHVFLGRWDVFNKYQLSRIMRKTIKSELTMCDNNSHKIVSFSGTNNPKLSNIAQAKWIKTNVINSSSYLMGQFYDGRYASTFPMSYIDMKVEIEDHDNPLWMFLYFGHGYYQWIADPYQFHYNDIDYCVNHDLKYQPFGFSFACQNGNLFKDNCFARSWLNVENGGIGMLASTVDALIECNRWFSRKLFSPLVDYQPTMTIGEFIANAKERYYYADQVPYRRNHIAKYIFLGDPSLYIHGLEIHHTRHHLSQRDSSTDDISPYKVRIFSINGTLVEETLYPESERRIFPHGIYIQQLFDVDDNLIGTIKIVR